MNKINQIKVNAFNVIEKIINCDESFYRKAEAIIDVVIEARQAINQIKEAQIGTGE